MLRATAIRRAAELHADPQRPAPFDRVVLESDERHLRRRVLQLSQGERLLVELEVAVALEHLDVLVLADGRHAEVVAAEEALYAVRARDGRHLAELAWHIGNRHLPAAVEEERILIHRDHVILAMLEGLGADVTLVDERFSPLRGAYHGHSHAHA
jgi:urease accessory protein